MSDRPIFQPTWLSGADGAQLHAVSAGNQGPVILFLHGFPEFWQAWHRQIEFFSAGFRAVALDLRGYNLSDKPRAVAAYSIDRLAADIRAVLHAISSDRPAILVGHDWGGIIAWAVARECPELLSRLIIINAPHPVIFERELAHRWSQRFASSYAAFFQARGAAEWALKAFNFAALRGMIFGTTAKPQQFSPELRASYLKAWSQPDAIRSGLNYYRNLRVLRNRLREPSSDWSIRVPTLVLWGDKDRALLPGNLVQLDRLVPDLTIKRHATATHWVVHEEPAWVNNAIQEFIAREPVPSLLTPQ